MKYIFLLVLLFFIYKLIATIENFEQLIDEDLEYCFNRKDINTMDYKYSKKVKIGKACCYLTPTRHTHNIPVISWNGYYLNNLCVKKEHRRQGHSKRLIEHILKEAKRESKDHIILMVNKNNPGAIRLYENFGFREHSSDSKLIIMVKNIV
jgi:ribosomal protein S18 acetylase RimI-like enzyme